MAFHPRFNSDEMVTPKQREAMAQEKNNYLAQIDDLLNTMPDDEIKQDLIRKRDHCMSKYPKFPVDLSIWKVAYYEDWVRAYRAAMELE